MTDLPTPSPGLLRGRPRWLVVLVVVVLLAAVTAGVLVLRSALAGPQAEVGEFIPDSTAVGAGPTVTVRLPWGELTVTATKPTQHIGETSLYSDKYDASLDRIDAPDDGSWVALRIRTDASFGGTLYRSRADATIPATSVTVLDGGRTIPVARAAGGGKPTSAQALASLFANGYEGYLALPTSPRDLHLRFEFDGVQQDAYPYRNAVTKRQAAPLYRAAATPVDLDCARGTVPGYRLGYTVSGTCTMSRLLHLPYVAGLGWAKAGRSWLVTTLRTYPPPQLFRTAPSGRLGTYYAREELGWTTQLRYGNATPRARAAFNKVNNSIFVDPDDPEQFVFDVPAGDDGKQGFTLVTGFTAKLSGDVAGLAELVQLTATRSITPR